MQMAGGSGLGGDVWEAVCSARCRRMGTSANGDRDDNW